MFKGANKMSLDAKGRMAMPARYREDIAQACGGQLVISVDQDGCLLIYPQPVWERIEQELTDMPSSDQQVKKLRRLMIGYADDVELDSAGRIRVSQELRDFAGLGRKVILIGQGKKFELWNEEDWLSNSKDWRENAAEDNEKSPALANFSW